MNGLKTEPSPKIIRTPKIKSTITIGINQNFLLMIKNFKNCNIIEIIIYGTIFV